MNADVWYRITIDNPDLTRGAELSDFLEKNLSDEIREDMVVIAGVEGSGDPALGIAHLGCVLIATAELKTCLKYTTQIDWGNFYFVKGSGQTLKDKICDGMTIRDAISESHLSMRVIDDSSIEVFAADYSLIMNILARHPSAHIDSCALVDMDFPQ